MSGVAVVGSGIVGLTSAIRLLEAGFKVTVLTKDLVKDTTSSVAAAMWHPGGAGEEPLKHWCQKSLEVFKNLSKDEHSGLRWVTAYELSDHGFVDQGLELADDLGLLMVSPFPEPWNYGYRFNTVQINTPTYMPFVLNRFKALGGHLEQQNVERLDTLPYDLIINASGVGAKDLARDKGVYPIRGQIIRIAKPKNFPDEIIHIHSGETFTYIIPRVDDCILGGTYQIGDDNKQPDSDTAKAILERTTAIKPELKDADILEHKVGLRPGRDTVRFEREELRGKVIIHNYGHGSIGHTLAWGCAEDVVTLAKN